MFYQGLERRLKRWKMKVEGIQSFVKFFWSIRIRNHAMC